MPAFVISIHLQGGAHNDYGVLSEAMKRENFTPANMAGFEEKEFACYGNLSLLHVTEIVKRVVASTGKGFSFAAANNKLTERQNRKLVHEKV